METSTEDLKNLTSFSQKIFGDLISGKIYFEDYEYLEKQTYYFINHETFDKESISFVEYLTKYSTDYSGTCYSYLIKYLDFFIMFMSDNGLELYTQFSKQIREFAIAYLDNHSKPKSFYSIAIALLLSSGFINERQYFQSIQQEEYLYKDKLKLRVFLLAIKCLYNPEDLRSFLNFLRELDVNL